MEQNDSPIPLRQFSVELLDVLVFANASSIGLACALEAGSCLQSAIETRGTANLLLAAGSSQMLFLKTLVMQDGIDWSKVNVFHMDEYLGIDDQHEASFRRFIVEQFVQHVPIANFYPIEGGTADPTKTCLAYEQLLRDNPADLVVLGLGENGHLAFNDPPVADFADPVWVKVVSLAEATRLQQVSSGFFDSLDQVPTEAITLTIPALLSARQVICLAPETRKAKAVTACLTQPVSERYPASSLRTIAHASLLLDEHSAAGL